MAKQQAVVYGAGEKAVSVKRSLTEADISVSYFVVSEKEGNPTNLDGLPVLSVEEFLRFRKDGMLALTADPADGRSKDPVVYIAVPDSEQTKVASFLRDNGYTEYMKVEPDSFGKMMKRYYEGLRVFPSVKNIPSDEDLEKKAFVASCCNESDESEAAIFHPGPWCRRVQTGAALAKKKFGLGPDGTDTGTVVYDNKGENISFLNKNYGMLTALYWMWKNLPPETEVLGLAQRRKMLDVKKAEITLLLLNQTDVMLPDPMISLPHLEDHATGKMLASDWIEVKKALLAVHPDYEAEAERILGNQYIYNNNVFVGRRQVIDDYCEWLFPVLKEAQNAIGMKKPEESYRYLEKAAEILCTIYFMSNQHGWRVSHTTLLAR